MQVKEYVSMFAQQLCCLYHAGVINAYLSYNYNVMKCVFLLHKDLLIKQWGWCVFWVQNDEIVCLWVLQDWWCLSSTPAGGAAPVKGSLLETAFIITVYENFSDYHTKVNDQIRDHLTW